MEPLYFKQFFELVEKQPNYVDTLQDELGIKPSSFEKVPAWAASVSLGDVSYNGIMYQIVKWVYKDGEIVGANIKPKNVPGNVTQRAYINKGHQKIRSPDSSVDDTVIFVSKDKLNKLLPQGMSQGAAGAAGGMAGGGMGALPGPGGAGGMPT